MNNPPRVDYDAVSSTYDLRANTAYLAGVRSALNELAERMKVRRLLDLGCGTGRSLQGFLNLRPRPLCVGLDFSPGMLIQARRLESEYRLVNASAPTPPFPDNHFDLVCCTLAFHHFPDKSLVVQRAYDMLRPGGAFTIVNFDPRETRHEWPIYEYFEGVFETDLQRFPAIADQEAMLKQVGFQQVSSPIVDHIGGEFVGEAMLDSYYLRKDASSQLILASDEVYQAGIDKIRATIEAAKSRGEKVIFRTDIKNRMCHGFKPE